MFEELLPGERAHLAALVAKYTVSGTARVLRLPRMTTERAHRERPLRVGTVIQIKRALAAEAKAAAKRASAGGAR